jgi:CRP-like cAMP-binding protein
MPKNVSLRDAYTGVANCRTCYLRESVLFAGLEEQDFERIHHPIEQFLLPPASVLYRAGDPAEYMYTVRSGLLKLVQYLPDGAQRIVRLVKATDVTGLEGLVGEPYQHNAVALQSTEICRLPVQVVERLSGDNPRLHRELLSRWQQALAEADAWLTELSVGPAKQRIARLLLRLASDQDSGECELFSREDLGAMLGITTETASRTIAEFKRQSLLVETHANRFLLDVPNLRRVAAD